MLYNISDFRHETKYKGPFEITKCYPNFRVALQCGAIEINYNIFHIKSYKSDTNIEDIKC